MRAEWDEQSLKIAHDECEKLLLEGDPRIAVLRHNRAIVFTMFMNEPGDEKLVAPTGVFAKLFNKTKRTFFAEIEKRMTAV